MKTNCLTASRILFSRCLVLVSALLAAGRITLNAHDRPEPRVSKSDSGSRSTGRSDRGDSTAIRLPRLPADVNELKFSEFFVNPVGPRGLELTDKLRSLDGCRVRIVGYMANRETQPPGTFLLTPYPLDVHDHDNSLAEDFPASVILVTVPTLEGKSVPYVRGLMLITGVLSLGNRAEADGRMSLVRLELDSPERFGRSRLNGPAPGKGAEFLRGRRSSR